MEERNTLLILPTYHYSVLCSALSKQGTATKSPARLDVRGPSRSRHQLVHLPRHPAPHDAVLRRERHVSPRRCSPPRRLHYQPAGRPHETGQHSCPRRRHRPVGHLHPHCEHPAPRVHVQLDNGLDCSAHHVSHLLWPPDPCREMAASCPVNQDNQQPRTGLHSV